MLVSECIKRINFFTSTQHDLTGKNLNAQFSNYNTVMMLKFALDRYANHTKGIEAIYSFPMDVDNNITIIDEPPLVLRSEAYRMMMITIAGFKYPIMMHDVNTTLGNFPTHTQGIPTWAMPFERYIYLYPQTGFTPAETLLNGELTDSATSITVDSTNGFEPRGGRITIGDEKIFYDSTTATTFNGCKRGFEGTTAISHSDNDAVKQNNITIFYRKRHFEISVNETTDIVSTADAAKEMEVYDEHLEVICKNTASLLLAKTDIERSNYYREYEKFLEQAKFDIQKTRHNMKSFGNIRSPYYFEQSYPHRYY